jgi:hypothetical protein
VPDGPRTPETGRAYLDLGYDDVALRLEGDISRDRAVAIAESATWIR